MILGIKPKTFGLTVLFTLIEAVVLAIWLSLAMNGETLLSFTVLAVGLYAEHHVSILAGKVETGSD